MAILIAVNVVVLNVNSSKSHELEVQREATVKTSNALQARSEALQALQKEKLSTDSSLKKERLKTSNLQRENESLKAKKQARLAAEAESTKTQKAPVSHIQSNAVAVTGSCDTWLAQAGVTDTASAKALISRESGCNPNAVNPSSGACGVAQELPCGKSGCSLGDGACQIAWMKRYVEGRYGSFAAALAHSYNVGWY